MGDRPSIPFSKVNQEGLLNEVKKGIIPTIRMIWQEGEVYFFDNCFIHHSKVNIEARRARHARLKGGVSPDPGKSPTPKRNFIQRLLAPLFRFFNVGDDFPLLKRLAGFVFAGTTVFFAGTLFVPLYHYTGWVEANYEEDFDLIAFTEDPTAEPISQLINDEGFLIKPAIKTSRGDRTESNQIFIYTVEAGDSLSSIAQQFGINKNTLVMENDLWNASRLRTGMQLRVLPVDGVSHMVEDEDTLSDLAKEYEVEIADILRQNKMDEGDVLIADSRVIIPGGEKEKPVVVASVPTPTYTGPRTTSGNAPATPTGSAAPSASGRLIWPTNSCGKMTQGFRGGHLALDIACVNRGPIYASASGTVVTAKKGWNGGYGNYIIVDHGGGMQTLYAHNETLYVGVGDYVTQGQTIAWMGNTGRVYGRTGIHVHWEVRINGAKYNPLNFL